MKVIRIGAIWCKECLVMKPIWKRVEEAQPELKTEYYDVDDNPEILIRFQAKKVPFSIFLDEAENELERLQGIQNEADLLQKVRDYLDK